MNLRAYDRNVLGRSVGRHTQLDAEALNTLDKLHDAKVDASVGVRDCDALFVALRSLESRTEGGELLLSLMSSPGKMATPRKDVVDMVTDVAPFEPFI